MYYVILKSFLIVNLGHTLLHSCCLFDGAAIYTMAVFSIMM
jgi:hypothetical protein